MVGTMAIAIAPPLKNQSPTLELHSRAVPNVEAHHGVNGSNTEKFRRKADNKWSDFRSPVYKNHIKCISELRERGINRLRNIITVLDKPLVQSRAWLWFRFRL